MTPEFIEAYTAVLNRSTEIMRKVQEKGVLQVGIDDQLIQDFNESQAEVKKYSDQITAMNQFNEQN